MTKQPLWSFERFESGVSFGSVEVPLDERRIKLWQEIYGELADEIIPEGLLVAAMMEAYIKAIQPRPKGNIHAAQKITFTNIKPLRGDTLSVVLTCVHKEIKKAGDGFVSVRSLEPAMRLSCPVKYVQSGHHRSAFNDLPEKIVELKLHTNIKMTKAYAELTFDFNPLHLDLEFAKKSLHLAHLFYTVQWQ